MIASALGRPQKGTLHPHGVGRPRTLYSTRLLSAIEDPKQETDSASLGFAAPGHLRQTGLVKTLRRFWPRTRARTKSHFPYPEKFCIPPDMAGIRLLTRMDKQSPNLGETDPSYRGPQFGFPPPEITKKRYRNRSIPTVRHHQMPCGPEIQRGHAYMKRYA